MNCQRAKTTKPKEIMTLEIDGSKITAEWWTPEVKELFCSLCKEDGNECLNKDDGIIVCEVANPYCG